PAAGRTDLLEVAMRRLLVSLSAAALLTAGAVTAAHGSSPRPRAHVSLAASSRHVGLDAPVTFAGQVSPNHAFERVQLQQQSGASWRTIARPRLDRHSRYRITDRFGEPGLKRVRALLPADSRAAQSTSRVVTILIDAHLGMNKIKHVVIIMQ